MLKLNNVKKELRNALQVLINIFTNILNFYKKVNIMILNNKNVFCARILWHIA